MNKDIADILKHAADPRLAANQLERFEAAYRDETDGDFDWTARGAGMLARIFGNSIALSDRLISNPGWADEIATSPYSASRKPESVIRAELASMIESAAPQGDEDTFMQTLRHFRHREMMRIVARDLNGATEVRELLEEWSDAADAIVDEAWRRAHETLVARLGKPMTPLHGGGEKECTGTVIALGKLGGRELNLSSDIDLITIYASDEGGASHPGTAHATNHEFYVRQTSLFTKLVSEKTEHGFAFRIDHELRPEGPQGPLSNSIDGAERYYEYFGADWERQALIRARPVAGDPELGEQFLEAVKPFVFRKSIALSDLAHMRKIKRKMERKSLRASAAFDVKLGSGGIREVEFLTQAICLLFGGNVETVRKGNTFDAIDALSDAGFIHPYGADRLKGAYSFLRRTENMLQATDDLQVHKLPADRRGLAFLARQLGFDGDKSVESLTDELERHRSDVTRLFQALFEADYERLELMDAIRNNAARAGNEEEAIDSLAWFKNREVRRIRQKDLAGNMSLPRTLRRLTLAAEAVLASTLEMATKHMEERFGTPRLEGGSRAGFAIVGLGSLGSGEMDYGSDIDLCFLYAGPGESDGDKRITNVEYFTKLAQRVISTISLPGRYGRAYKVDSELRPSGRSGTLVATLDSFIDYHTDKSQVWERLSLMKARAITGDVEFMKAVRAEIERLAFELPTPPANDVKAEIAKLRERTIEERIGDKPETYNLKIGRGGLADLESIFQFHQLMAAADHPELRRPATFEVLEALRESGEIDPGVLEELSANFRFLRRLLSRLRLAIERATDEINCDAWYCDVLAYQMGIQGKGELTLEIERRLAENFGLFEGEFGPV